MEEKRPKSFININSVSNESQNHWKEIGSHEMNKYFSLKKALAKERSFIKLEAIANIFTHFLSDILPTEKHISEDKKLLFNRNRKAFSFSLIWMFSIFKMNRYKCVEI